MVFVLKRGNKISIFLTKFVLLINADALLPFNSKNSYGLFPGKAEP